MNGNYGYISSLNIIAMVIKIFQLIILFMLLGQSIHYFGEISVMPEVCNRKNGFYYYTLYANDAKSSNINVNNFFILNDLQKTLLELREQNDYLYITCSLNEYVGIEVNNLKEHFRTDVYNENENYLAFSEHPGYYQSYPDLKLNNPEMFNGINYTWMSAVKMDKNAFEHYEIKTKDGMRFTEEDFVHDLKSNIIPILLGANYQTYYNVGDNIPLLTDKGALTGIVKGILEKNTFIENDSTYEHIGGHSKTLDYSIILPYFNFEGAIDDNNIKNFVMSEYMNQLVGTMVFSDKLSKSYIDKSVKNINQIYMQNHLFTVRPSTESNGFYFFQSESKENIKLFSVVLVATYIFYLLSHYITICNEVHKKTYIHTIQMMLGITKRKIFLFYAFELGVVYSISIALVILWNREWLYQGIKAWAALILLGAIQYMICLYYVKCRLKKINMSMVINRRS